MKILSGILLFILCFTSKSFSQDSSIHLTKITPKEILLDKGWKYMTGDNPEWAKPGFDDNAWQSIDPTLDVHNALLQISTSGIGWFRLHLSLDNSLLKSELSFVIQQSGASEIYLNGTKIQGYGILNSNPEKVKADDPIWKPLSISFNGTGEQVIAVRYALQPHIYYTKIFETENPALTIKLMDSDRAVDYFHNNAIKIAGFSFVLFGITIMIIILHLSFYILYPTQKANLYFGLFAVMFALANITQLIFWLYPKGVANKFYLGNFTFALFIIGYVFLSMAAYLFLERKRDFFFYFLLVFAGIAIILNAWPYGFGWQMGGPTFELLVQINIARFAILSTIKKQRGAWIIAVGAVSTLVFFAIFLAQGTFTNSSFLLSLPPLRIFTYVMQNISLPTASSVFLAFEFAFANRTLQKKLLEVNELSQKNLAQEKEKQQLLASQNETLEQQVEERTAALKETLKNLKDTQSQLIQSEKMASLGELTAGIAHEIQNPLNFVNNFSEVNTELSDELAQEAEKGNIDEIKIIVKDIKENSEKINHHGKRADAIVKGMLQHSQASTGKKEPTYINSLADEYLRLSYHNIQAKDKSLPTRQAGFNATLKTDFDETIGNINIIPQDIGRVLLNLYNNAFYAVNEKLKAESLKQKAKSETYESIVSVSTKRVEDKIVVSVKDNGNGIPQKIADKIFQPFFTTKPTGQGTGLGLSLSYDIIKAHGDEIKVNTIENEGTEFIIQLPII